MDSDRLFSRYRELQSYVGWTAQDAERIVASAALLEPCLHRLVDDFYAEIERHPAARKVITGGQAQIDRLKETLVHWIRELLAGTYDADYVARRWRVGWRHVEIGLEQVYTNVALSRLRTALIRALHMSWPADSRTLEETASALNKLLDLDLAIIEDAYQAEYMARLQRTERLATLGQVAGGVAHELRNPLNVVQTSVYYLLNARNPTPEKKTDHLKRIERNVELADSVITALSNFARVQVPALAPIAIEPLLSEALELNPPGDGIEVAVDCPAGLPRAGRRRSASDRAWQLDSQRARRDVAGGATGDLGRGRPWLRGDRGGRYGCRHRGDGPGQGHGAFVLDEGAGTWTGACNHQIDRGEEPGGPRRQERAGAWQHLHNSTQRITCRRREAMTRREEPRILVVDDDPDICDNLRDILSDLGYQVDTAHDGPSALALLGRRPYDIALLDLKMPGMDGLALYREIKKRRAGTVSLLVTAFAGAATAEEAISAGAWKVLPKPVDFPKLLKFVKQALDQPLVLIVDDDRDLCENLWDLLRDRGFRVCVAHDLPGAAAALRDSSFEVVLIDLRIPDADGSSVFRAVRATNPESRTVLITGYRRDTDQLVAQLLAEGADAVQYKPFRIPDLIETLSQLALARADDAKGGQR